MLDLVNLCTMKKYAEVLSESEEIIKRYPKSHRVLNVVGVANSALGKYEIAIDIYLKALQISRKIPKFIIILEMLSEERVILMLR